MKKNLNEMGVKVLEKFILEFLPNSGNNRKYNTNELSFVEQTISNVFLKLFGIKIKGDEIIKAFEELDYVIHFRKDNSMGEDVFIQKLKIIKGKAIPISGYEENDASLIHFQVKGPDVKNLSRILKTLPPNTSEEKLKKSNELREKLSLFALKYK